jgi:glutamyl-tRNA reductase
MPAAGFGAAQEIALPEPHAPIAHASPEVATLTLFVLSFELTDRSLDDLERIGRELTEARLARIFATTPDLTELLLLKTCQRVEVYGIATRDSVAPRVRSRLPSPDRWTAREEQEAVGHLLRVAAGLESVAVGEQEVRAQIDQAARSVLSRDPRPVLKSLFLEARSTADRFAPQPCPARSIAALAASRVLEECGDPFPRVLVVGAGTVGRQVAELLAPRARLTLVYREHPPDPAFLRALGVRAVPSRQLAQELTLCDAVVTAAKTAGRLLLPSDFDDPAQPARPRLVIDLGVPRNVDPATGAVPGVRLIDLTQLGPSVPSRERIDPLSGRIDGEVDRVYRRFLDEASEPFVSALFQRAEAIRERELRTARPHLGTLTPEQSHAVDLLTLRLTRQLLLPAARRLRSTGTGPEDARLRRAALELFRADPSTP